MKKIIIMFAIMFTAVFSNCEASHVAYLGESATQVYSLDISDYEVVNENDYIMSVITHDKLNKCVVVLRVKTDRSLHTYTMINYMFIKDDMVISNKYFEVKEYTEDSLVAKAIRILDKLESEVE